MISIFSTHHSLSRSILTADKPSDLIDGEGPISIFTICKNQKLNKVRVVEDSLSGFYEVYSNAEKENIQLIFGLEISVKEIGDTSYSNVILWIKNSNGYKDLLNINKYIESEGYEKDLLKGFIDWETLNNLVTENILVTIPFYSGFLARNLTILNNSSIPKFTKIKPIFLIENHNLPFDNDLKVNVINFCEKNGFECVQSHRIYYFRDSDSEKLQIARCISQRTTFEKPELPHFASDNFSYESYLRENKIENENFFDKNFSKYEISGLKNGVRLPEIFISEKDKFALNLKGDCSNYEYLVALVKKGFKQKILSNPEKKKNSEIYIKRCKEELEILNNLYIVDYILLVSDILNWCLNENIPIGPGRGSSSGSLVMYLLNVVDIDPIEYGLYFSRFISPARAKSQEIDGIIYLNGSTMPDVDSDISYKHRHRVIEYITNKYNGKTAKIGTTTTLTGKLAIKEVCKAYLNYSEIDAKHISDMIDKVFGTVIDLDKAYEENKNFKNWVDSDLKNKRCYEIALGLENLIKNRGQHASGIAISFDKIDELVPIIRSSDGDSMVTAYDMKNVANVLVKVDILGLKTLDVLSETCNLVNIDYNKININDDSIYNFLNKNDNYHGLFQIEKGLGKRTILDIRPENIKEYSACISLGRPGSFRFIKDYLLYKKENKFESFCKEIDNFLSKTNYCILYQEQITEICHNVYGLDEKDADMIRYAIGKKNREEMAKWEPVIFKKGKELGIPEEATKKFWSTCNASADYLFNASHAFSYSTISARTTYVKSNYPLQFFLSLLRMAKNEPNPMEEIGIIQRELYNFGIKLLPPSVKYSSEDFELEGNNIRYGLSSIKGISDAAIKKLASFNRIYSNKFNLFDNCLDAKLGLGVVSSLIQSGCFPEYSITRAKLLLEFQVYNILTDKEKIYIKQFSEKLNEDLFSIIKYLSGNKNDSGKLYIKETRLETIKKKYSSYKKIYDFNIKNGNLLAWLMENKCLGYSYSGTLSEIYKKEFPDIEPIYSAITDENNTYHTVIGIAKEISEGKSKANKTPYVKFLLNDDYNSITLLAFKDKINYFLDENKKMMEDDVLVVARFKKMDDSTGFIEKATVLWDSKLVSRINQIKD